MTGRTGFDRAACAALAPSARYYPCNETLRPLFYTGTLWHAREFAAAPVLFLPQGNYPLKNLHTVIKALPAVLAQYGNAQLQIAGWPPLVQTPQTSARSNRLSPAVWKDMPKCRLLLHLPAPAPVLPVSSSCPDAKGLNKSSVLSVL